MKGMRAGLVVAVAIAIAVMAVGAGSATAATTKLCKVNPLGSPCPSADIYSAGTVFTVSGAFELSGITSCAMKYTLTTKSASGSPLEAEVTPFSLSTCTGGDTVAPHNPPWLLKITVIGSGPNGNSEMSRSGLTPAFDITIPTQCAYGEIIPQEIFGGSRIETVTPLPLTSFSGDPHCPAGTELTMLGKPSPSFYVTE